MEMMTGRTLFRNYKEYDQKEVEICGWVKSNRGSKKFGFLIINDGTFFEPIQVVYDQEMGNFDTPIINAVRKQIAPTANDSKRRFHSIVNPKTDASILKFSGIR